MEHDARCIDQERAELHIVQQLRYALLLEAFVGGLAAEAAGGRW